MAREGMPRSSAARALYGVAWIAARTFLARSGVISLMLCFSFACWLTFFRTSSSLLPVATQLQPGITSAQRSSLTMIMPPWFENASLNCYHDALGPVPRALRQSFHPEALERSITPRRHVARWPRHFVARGVVTSCNVASPAMPHPEFPNLTVLDHPLIQHKLTILRDRNTATRDFKQLVNEIAILIAYEATQDLPLETVEVETPLEHIRGVRVAVKKLALVPILRAGL